MDFIIGIFSLADFSAEDLLWDRRPWAEHSFYCGPSIGPMELAHLAVTLGVGDYEATIGGFPLLAGESQDVPWVIGIPTDLIEAVSSLEENDIEIAARTWPQRADLASRFTVDELKGYLKDAGQFLRDVPGPHVLRVVAADQRLTDRGAGPAGKE